MGLAPFQIVLCIITVHHKAEEADFTLLKEFHQLLVCLFSYHIRLLLEFLIDCSLDFVTFSWKSTSPACWSRLKAFR